MRYGGAEVRRCGSRIILSIVVLLFAGESRAQSLPSDNESLPTRRIIEKVGIRVDDKQDCTIYLPKSYTSEKKWPIVYCFDPGARGKLPVEKFQAAAEKFGYIVVASNDSRNSLKNSLLTVVIQNLWKETHTRLSIDDSRVY